MPWPCLRVSPSCVAQALKDKGSDYVCCRRVFTQDDSDYFARALKLYADMGWPMNEKNLSAMFADVAAKMNRLDPATNKPFVCGPDFVREFLEDHPELKKFKSSNIDPLRVERASPQADTLTLMNDRALTRDTAHLDHLFLFEKNRVATTTTHDHRHTQLPHTTSHRSTGARQIFRHHRQHDLQAARSRTGSGRQSRPGDLRVAQLCRDPGKIQVQYG